MSTRSDILNSAELLLRTKGYAAFSYADLAEEVGIKKASIHHHFATKEVLGVAIIESYLFRFSKRLEVINEECADVLTRLNAFSRMFIDSSESEMLPLCGALAAELSILPESLRELTRKFFDIHLAWLERNIVEGQSSGIIKVGVDAAQVSRAILNLLEGSSFVSWALGEKVDDHSGINLLIQYISK